MHVYHFLFCLTKNFGEINMKIYKKKYVSMGIIFLICLYSISAFITIENNPIETEIQEDPLPKLSAGEIDGDDHRARDLHGGAVRHPDRRRHCGFRIRLRGPLRHDSEGTPRPAGQIGSRGIRFVF